MSRLTLYLFGFKTLHERCNSIDDVSVNLHKQNTTLLCLRCDFVTTTWLCLWAHYFFFLLSFHLYRLHRVLKAHGNATIVSFFFELCSLRLIRLSYFFFLSVMFTNFIHSYSIFFIHRMHCSDAVDRFF